MRRFLSLVAVAALAACSSDSITGVNLTSPAQLVGSYNLAVYNATPNGSNPGGILVLRADSTFTLTVNASTPWAVVSGGRWSWTGKSDPASGNVWLKPRADFPQPWAFSIYGSFQSDGLGFTEGGFPALFFRRN